PPTYTYSHPILKEPVYFGFDDVEHRKANTPQQEYGKRLTAAGKDANGLMQAGLWALKRGLVREFYAAVDKALEADPRHATAVRVRELKKQLEQPLKDNPDLERELQNIVKTPGMQAYKSDHFLLVSDAPTKPAQGQRKNRANERLDLLEKSYETFLMLF